MKPAKHDPLLKELLADASLEAVRRQSLEQGMAVARRRRQRANWAKGGLIAASLVAALWLLIPIKQNPAARNRVAHAPAATNAVVPATDSSAARNRATVLFISDDELLALFPGRSLALIGPPGRMTLVFLEPSSATDRREDGSSR